MLTSIFTSSNSQSMVTSLNFDYFFRLTDKYGIIQFSRGKKRDLGFGYAVEDQARALILALRLGDQALVEKFLEIVLAAVTKQGVFMLWDRFGRHEEKIDKFGEASAEVLWALCEYAAENQNVRANRGIEMLISNLKETPHLRASAYSLLGLSQIKERKEARLFLRKLSQSWREHAQDDWCWYEDILTYANPLLPWSQLRAASKLNDQEAYELALGSLDFLLSNLVKNGRPITVGNRGWWQKGKEMALFDQQPIDIAYMILALLEAYKSTGSKTYLEKAKFYESWFGGNNLKGVSMIRLDGGCADGLTELGIGKNAGAESTICYLLSKLEIEKLNSSQRF